MNVELYNCGNKLGMEIFELGLCDSNNKILLLMLVDHKNSQEEPVRDVALGPL